MTKYFGDRPSRRYGKVHKTRAAHGSVRVGFVPNPEPTRRNRVRKKCTRRRPAGVIGSDSSNHQQVAGGLVGVIDLRRQRENNEKTQIRRINADSGDSFPDSSEISLRSDKNLTGFDEISPDSVKISLDLREISPESGFIRWNLENYRRILEILAGI